MKSSFWIERWQTGKTSFHRTEANEALLAHLGTLSLAKGNRVFIPLCGKTVDIDWLLSQGFRVAGAELSAIAVEEVFERLGIEPSISNEGALKHYHAAGLDLFVGDIFKLSAEILRPVDAVYDRAALIALPPAMRQRYAPHIGDVTGGARQLLLAVEYDQEKMDGPPFSVNEAEVRELYGNAYAVTCQARAEVPGGIKGKTPGSEAVWLLK